MYYLATILMYSGFSFRAHMRSSWTVIKSASGKIVLFIVAFALAGFAGAVANAGTSSFKTAGFMGLKVQDVGVSSSRKMSRSLGLRLPAVNIKREVKVVEDYDREVAKAHLADASSQRENWLYMMNLYYDYDSQRENQDIYGTTIRDSGVALGISGDAKQDWQLDEGLSYRLDDDLSVTSRYRYLDSSDLDFNSRDIDYDSHEVSIGLKYQLPVEIPYVNSRER